MFPKEITDLTPNKGLITIWCQYTDVGTNQRINIRCVLKGVYSEGNSNIVFENTGQIQAGSVTYFIPNNENVTGRKFLTPEEWNNIILPSGFTPDEFPKVWTLNPRQSPLQMIVGGDYPQEFSWGTQTQLANAEQLFMNSNPLVRRIRAIDDFVNVPLRISHFEVLC